LLALGGDQGGGGLDELVEQAGRGFAQVLAELAEANDGGLLAGGLFDPDLVGLRQVGKADEGKGGAEAMEEILVMRFLLKV
jgi:hypothetical protein